MLEVDKWLQSLDLAGLNDWREPLQPVLQRANVHGDLPKWREALTALPPVEPGSPDLHSPVVTADPGPLSAGQQERIEMLLRRLSPWRKGPFKVGNVLVDAEWRSDRKWRRLEPTLSPLQDRRVLDVGCGNGYYALRMLGAGAEFVLGIDPMLLYVLQFEAICHFMPPVRACALPLRLTELPEEKQFDSVFSMGVLYHQRQPGEHLSDLHKRVRKDGELVLETLVLPGKDREERTPGRYARMRNVWRLPTVPLLLDWLGEAGFAERRVADVSRTTVEEQRSTDWMPFESLAAALNPEDPDLTVEGWPAPLRAIVVCRSA